MTRPRTLVLLSSAVTVAAVGLEAQPPAQTPARFETATSAVVVDVIARDKKGPVSDLTQADFEVFEDGKAQQIVTFERRTPDALSTAVRGVPSVASGGVDGVPPPVVVADRTHSAIDDRGVMARSLPAQ